MNIYVLGEDLQIIGVVNKYSALQWVDTWSKEGSFQLWAPLNDENSSLLVRGNLIWIEEDTLGVIQRVVRELDEEGERTISVSGKFVECWIQKRIVWGKFVSNNSFVTDVMRSMVYNHCINPTDSRRKLPYIVLSDNQSSLGPQISITRSYSNVWGECVSLSQTYDLHPRLRFNRKNRSLVFSVVTGSDKSSLVTIDSDLGEILKSSYTEDMSNLKTTALIAGQGEDEDRVTTDVGNEKSGLERVELYVDARDLSKTNSEGSVLTEEEYIAMLQQRGTSKLSDNPVYVDYLCSINTDNQKGHVYGVDYSLGDVVSLQDKLLKIQLSAKVVERARYWDQSGLTTDLTVGIAIPTISEMIKKGV